MSRRIYIDKLNLKIEEPLAIIQIAVEDALVYRDIFYSIKDLIVLSEDNKVLNNDKVALVIDNPLNIYLNDKKVLASLYKYLSINLNDEIKNEVNEINQKMIELLDDVILYNDFALEYDDNFDIQKLFSLFQLRFKKNEKNIYFENLLNYLKLYNIIANNKFIISFSLLDLLTTNEMEILKKELLLLDINLINFSLSNKQKESKTYVVDSDWCVL